MMEGSGSGSTTLIIITVLFSEVQVFQKNYFSATVYFWIKSNSLKAKYGNEPLSKDDIAVRRTHSWLKSPAQKRKRLVTGQKLFFIIQVFLLTDWLKNIQQENEKFKKKNSHEAVSIKGQPSWELFVGKSTVQHKFLQALLALRLR